MWWSLAQCVGLGVEVANPRPLLGGCLWALEPFGGTAQRSVIIDNALGEGRSAVWRQVGRQRGSRGPRVVGGVFVVTTVIGPPR